MPNGTPHSNGLPRTISIHQKGVKENDIELDTSKQRINQGIYPMGPYNSSHIEISSQSNNRDSNQIRPIITTDNIDNDTHLAVGTDKGRKSNIPRASYHTEKNMMINLPSLGASTNYDQEECASDTTRHNYCFCGHNIDNNKLIYLHPTYTNEIYSQAVPLIGIGEINLIPFAVATEMVILR